MQTILVDAVDTLFVETDAGFEVFAELQKLLDGFPNPKIIVTNATQSQYKEYAFDKAPYELFSLYNDPPKTNPKFFETMLGHFGLQPTDVVYFEHNPEAVKAAQSVGITSYFYDAAKRDLADLKAFLEKNLH